MAYEAAEGGIEIGKYNRLKASRHSEHGWYLSSKNGEEVLLPGLCAPKALREGDTLDVFVYTDSEDRIVATTLTPKATVGEFAVMEVVDTTHYGAFVDWGLPKDLFVPLSQQKAYFKKGDRYVLRVCLDERTQRVYATQRLGKYFSRDTNRLKRGDAYDIVVLAKTPLGYKVIVDHRFEGMLFANEVFETLEVGQRLRAYVNRVRKDGKLDMRLQPTDKREGDVETQRRIVQYLTQHDGVAPFTYKSDAAAIYEAFGVSKKAFKRALTALLDAEHIALEDSGIRLRLNKE